MVALYEVGAKSLWVRSRRPKAFRETVVFTSHKPQITDHCRVQKAFFALGSSISDPGADLIRGMK